MIDQNPNSPMTNEARIPPRKVARQKSRKNTRHRYGIRILAAVGLVLVIAATAVYAAQETANEGNSSAQKPSSTENADQIKRGEYLVHDVAKCIVCHTPKNNAGNLIESRLLEGATVPVANPYPNQKWALEAPDIAGLPGGWSKEGLSKFLQTGKTPTDYPIRPPMPSYRMNERDANAIAAYLQSL